MAPAGKNNPQLQARVAAAAAVGLGPNSNWAQIYAAQDAAQRKAAQQKQVEDYNRRLNEQAQAIREQQMAPPAAQDFSKKAEEGDKRLRRSSARGSLLAGNTGGYNPATGGGKLGGRSLLG